MKVKAQRALISVTIQMSGDEAKWLAHFLDMESTKTQTEEDKMLIDKLIEAIKEAGDLSTTS